MKIYWSDPPPPDAIFFQQPFDGEMLLIKDAVRVHTLPPPISYLATKQTFLPTKQDWIAAVEKTLQNRDIEKVVLARCCVLECDIAPDPFAIAAALQPKAKNATVFCFADEHSAFLGASPEKLFTREGREVKSDVLAGTGVCNEKTLREFTFVQTFLLQKFSAVCKAPPSCTPVTWRHTHNVSHLHAQITGTLYDHISDQDLLNTLHPTPALSGTPTQNALDCIRKTEPFPRGLYGGVVGWKTESASDHLVAIRSCLIQGKTVRLYTGAGIVAGSDPEEEWNELNAKMSLYQGIFL